MAAAVGAENQQRARDSVVAPGSPAVRDADPLGRGVQLNENPVAFCEAFDQPSPVTNRSGEMNGDPWGVQRIGGIAWPGLHQA